MTKAYKNLFFHRILKLHYIYHLMTSLITATHLLHIESTKLWHRETGIVSRNFSHYFLLVLGFDESIALFTSHVILSSAYGSRIPSRRRFWLLDIYAMSTLHKIFLHYEIDHSTWDLANSSPFAIYFLVNSGTFRGILATDWDINYNTIL